MISVVSLRVFVNSPSVALPVLVDLQQEYLAEPSVPALAETGAAPANCGRVPAHAHRIGQPGALVRRIEGGEPHRNEMIFERSGPSCYSSESFAPIMDQGRGGVVVAGSVGGPSCPSVPIDAVRKHEVTCLSDASASHALEDMSADDVHAVSTISGLYAEVCEASGGIAAVTPRKLGQQANGMSAGG